MVFHQVLGAVWYGVFGRPWVAGLGKSMAELTARGELPYLISVGGSALTVLFVALLFQRLAVQGVAAGLRWAGCPGPVWSFRSAPSTTLRCRGARGRGGRSRDGARRLNGHRCCAGRLPDHFSGTAAALSAIFHDSFINVQVLLVAASLLLGYLDAPPVTAHVVHPCDGAR